MARDIGIDLGTANTLIYMKGKGIILREPSVVAVDIRNDTVKFVGDEAKEVVGRTPASIVAVRPLKDGVIADFDIAASMLQLFIKKTLGSVTFNRPRVVICIPSGVTAVERPQRRERWRGTHTSSEGPAIMIRTVAMLSRRRRYCQQCGTGSGSCFQQPGRWFALISGK